MIMKGKKGVILGIANKKSIAYGIAKACQEQGAQMAITFLNERFEQKLAPIAEELECGARLYPCDVSKPEEIKALKASLGKRYGSDRLHRTLDCFCTQRRIKRTFYGYFQRSV